MNIWFAALGSDPPPLTLADWANIATLAGIPIAALVLLYTAYQVHQNTLISRGQFWLELEKMFNMHNEVHINLRPGGKWAASDTGPQDNEDWAKVEDYMGLFEHCELMLRKRLLDNETFSVVFSYRLHNIVANRTIVNAKLRRAGQSWQAFIRLLKRLRIEIPDQS